MTSVKEAVQWLSYTYLYVRMMQNPLPYGITWADLSADPRLEARRCLPSAAAPQSHADTQLAPSRHALLSQFVHRLRSHLS